jgi:hypothetical protein
LRPVGHNAHGRTDFEIHGDSVQHPGQGLASTGCVVADHRLRAAIARLTAGIMFLMSFNKLLVAVAVSFAAVAFAQTATLTPENVLKEIEAKGAKAVMSQWFYANNGRDWERLLDKIDTGADAWLEVARKIRPGTDAGATLGLKVSLAIALTHNPEGVLKMVPDTFPMEEICTVPFIESSKAKDMAHIRKVRLALKRVTSPDLKEKRDTCQGFIEKDAKAEKTRAH